MMLRLSQRSVSDAYVVVGACFITMSDESDDYRHVIVGSDSEVSRTKLALGEIRSPKQTGTCDWVERPTSREECPEGNDPCPFIGCRYHLAIDEATIGEALAAKPKLASGFILIDRNCALKFVDSHPGGATLEEVGEELLLTRERVRQIEVKALEKLRLVELFIEIAKAD